MSGYTIRELIIKIHSNILKGQDKYDVFEFTKNNIYLPDSNKKFNKVLNTYPYFTYEFKYPRDKLLSLNMRKRIETFFNLEQFVLYITTYGEKSINDTAKQINECAYENVMTMLEVLFPTQFPIYNNIKDSHTYYVNGNRSLQKHMLSMITQPFIKKYYSYMKHNGETYTISKVIWINDMLNHSVYKDLIEKYQEYITSKTSPLKREFNNYLKPLLSDSTSSERYKSIYNNFQEKIDEIVKQEETNRNISRQKAQSSQKQQVNHILYHANKCYYEIAPSTNEGKESNTVDYNCQQNSNNFDLNTSILENHKGKKVYYYIELAIDYFQGEFNNKNKSMYVCNYTSNHLGDLFEKILMTKELVEKSHYWSVDLDRAPLYNKTSSLKQEKTIKLDDTNDKEENKEDKYVQLFSEILDEGRETINTIEKMQGSGSHEDIDINDLYRFYINQKKSDANYIEEVYQLKQKPGSNTLLVSTIQANVSNLTNTKEEANTIYKAMLKDILKYVKDINGEIKSSQKKEGNTNGGKHMTRKLKKKRFNVTIKKN